MPPTSSSASTPSWRACGESLRTYIKALLRTISITPTDLTRLRAIEKAARTIDPDKLDVLADWVDAIRPNDPDPEVQRQLRKWADALRAAILEEKK